MNLNEGPEVAPKFPPEATFLLFEQGEAHPDWTNPTMGMTTDGIVGETIIGYGIFSDPATVLSSLDNRDLYHIRVNFATVLI